MATKYKSQLDAALRLIQAKGMPLSIHKTSGTGIDPVTQEDYRVQTSYVANGVQLPVSNIGKETSNQAPNSPRKRKNTKFLVAAKNLSIVPEAGDSLSVLESVWEISTVDSISPDGVPIIFTIIAAQ